MITTLTDKAISIQRPKIDSLHAYSLIQIEGMRWVHFLDKDNNDVCHAIELPPGAWKILNLGSELTEAQWREVVAYIPYGNLQRWKEYSGNESFCLSATESGLSLLRSKGLQGENTLILIKQ